MSCSFQYVPLSKDRNEIRLIRLLPGSWNDGIRCITFIVSFNDRPLYGALSYAWGDPDTTDLIELDGQTFNATTNLISALRHLRLTGEPRTLWVDALCINQQDDEEKSWQVNLMGQIYSRCVEGLLWVGEESEACDACCRFGPHPDGDDWDKTQPQCAWNGRRPRMSRLTEVVDPLRAGDHLDSIPAFQTISRSELLDFETMEPILALGAFVKRKWWTRVWTVQEAILPPVSNFYCGSLQFSFNEMKKAAHNAERHFRTCCFHLLRNVVDGNFFTPDRHSHRIPSAVRIWFVAAFAQLANYQNARKTPCAHAFMESVVAFRSREAKDPRDRIYAFLALMPTNAPFVADYTISASQLEEKLSLFLLSQPVNTPLYPLCKPRYQKPTNRPSWVNAFTDATQLPAVDLGNRYAAGGKLVKSQRCSATVFSVSAVKVDVLAHICSTAVPVNTSVIERRHILRGWAQSLDLLNRSELPYVCGGTLRGAFVKMLDGSTMRSTEFDAETGMAPFIEPIFSDMVEEPLSTSRFSSFFIQNRWKKPFMTQSGLIGMGPHWMQPGDEIWIIYGGDVPFLLRPLEKDNINGSSGSKVSSLQYHVVIGECYVQGIMHGEAIRDPTREQLVFLK